MLSWLTIQAVEHLYLTTQLSSSYQKELRSSMEAEKKLTQMDLTLQKAPHNYQAEGAIFVADHLGFNCSEGVDIVSVKVPPLESFLALPFSFPHAPKTFKKKSMEIISFEKGFMQPEMTNIIPPGLNPVNIEGIDLIGVEPPHSKVFDNLAGYAAFKLENKLRPFTAYGLANCIDSKEGILFQVQPNSLASSNTYRLPFSISNGTLLEVEAFFEGKWHSILIATVFRLDSRVRGNDGTEPFCTVPGQLCENCLMLFFDVTDPKKPLKPFFSFAFSDSHLQNPVQSSAPIPIRLRDGRFGILMTVCKNQESLLQMILLEPPFNSIKIASSKENFNFLVAIDPEQQAFVDKIYAGTANFLWGIDLSEHYEAKMHPLVEAEIKQPPIVVKNAQDIGHRIYFLGKIAATEGLFMVEDKHSSDIHANKEPPSIQLIQGGKFEALHVRFGRLILIAKDLKDHCVLNLPDNKILPRIWQRLAVKGSLLDQGRIEHERQETQSVECIKCIWDPETETDTFLILNAGSQLSIFSAAVNKDKYGRVLWRLNN